MKYLLSLFMLLLFAANAGAADGAKSKKQWSLKDTVSSALSYSPAVKSSEENVRMAKESVRQARAGNLPKVDVEARTGFGTLPVSKYD